MNATPMRVVLWAGTLALAGAALAAEPPKSQQPVSASKPMPRPTIGALAVDFHLQVVWGAAPAISNMGDPTGCASWTGHWPIFEWGVRNNGTQASLTSQLTLTCAVAGGSPTMPQGQADYFRLRLCKCNARVFTIPSIPPGQTYGLGLPPGLTWLETYQGTDYVECADPFYPHAVVTAKIGSVTAVKPLCK